MKALKEFIIPFVGLKLGKHDFEFEINNTFFQNFDYKDLNNVSVSVDLQLEKKSTLLELMFKASGKVNINCDVSNEPFDQVINDNFNLVVKFGEEYNNDNDDILILPHGEYELNVAQYIYELIVLAIPVKRIHPGIEDGTLKSDVVDKLKEYSPERDKTENSTGQSDPRWDNLKKLLTDK